MTASIPWRCSSCPRSRPEGPAPTMTTWVRVSLEVILEVDEPLARPGIGDFRVAAAGAQRGVSGHGIGFIGGVVDARDETPLRIVAPQLERRVHGGDVVALSDLRRV